MSFSAAATGLRSFQETKSRLWRSRWTMQVCTMASGNTAVIASGKPFRPSTTAISTSSTPPVLELAHDAQPEFGALGLLDPQPQDLLGAVGPNPECHVDRLVADQGLLADLHPQGVKEDQ